MLKKSKLMSMVLALAFILSAILPISASAAISFSDLPSDHTYYQAITNLAAEGIINGFEDGSYKPEDPVTRAQFTKIICYATYVGDMTHGEDAKKVFSDVAPDHWAINNIITAYKAKIINGMGDGTFNPDGKVLYEQAVKMAACAIGYPESRAEREGGYPAAFIKFAQKQGMLKNVAGVQGEPLTRAKVAQLIDNMRNAKRVDTESGEQGESLREETTTSSSVEGRIVAINGVALYHAEVATTTCRNNQIELEKADGTRESFWIDNINIENAYDYLGRSVTVHYDVDAGSDYDQATNIVFQSRRNAEFTVDIDDVASYSSTLLEYYDENDNEKKYSIASGAIIVHNGQAINTTFDVIMAGIEAGSAPYNNVDAGNIKLVCSNSADTADVIFISTYKTYYATSVTKRTYTVTDGQRGGIGSVVLDETDRSKKMTFTKNGSSATFSNIATYNMVSVAESQNGKIVDVRISDKTASGTIESIVGGKIKLKNSDKLYEKITRSSGDVGLVVGNAVLLRLDAFGKIVDTKVTSSTTLSYGYLSSVEDNGTMGSSLVQVMIYKASASNSKINGNIYTLAEKVKIDGHVYTMSSEANAIKTALSTAASGVNGAITGGSPVANATYAQPIRYAMVGSTISEIITATNNGAYETAMNLKAHTADSGDTQYLACTTDRTVLGRYSVSGSTPIIVVPADRTNGTYYTKSNSYFEKDKSYYVQIANPYNSAPSAIYVYGLVGGSGAMSTLSEDNVPMIVKASDPALKDGITTTKLTMVSPDGTNEVVGYKGDFEGTSGIDSAVVGDIVRVAIDDAEYITAFESVITKADMIAANAAGGFSKDEDGVATTDQAEEFRVFAGRVHSKEGNAVIVAPSFNMSATNTERIDVTNTKIYVVDDTANIVVSESDVSELMNGSKIFMFSVRGTIKMIVVY